MLFQPEPILRWERAVLSGLAGSRELTVADLDKTVIQSVY